MLWSPLMMNNNQDTSTTPSMAEEPQETASMILTPKFAAGSSPLVCHHLEEKEDDTTASMSTTDDDDDSISSSSTTSSKRRREEGRTVWFEQDEFGNLRCEEGAAAPPSHSAPDLKEELWYSPQEFHQFKKRAILEARMALQTNYQKHFLRIYTNLPNGTAPPPLPSLPLDEDNRQQEMRDERMMQYFANLHEESAVVAAQSEFRGYERALIRSSAGFRLRSVRREVIGNVLLTQGEVWNWLDTDERMLALARASRERSIRSAQVAFAMAMGDALVAEKLSPKTLANEYATYRHDTLTHSQQTPCLRRP